jgi:hypothetical protein
MKHREIKLLAHQAIGWMTKESWFNSGQKQRGLPSPKRPDRLGGPNSLPFSGYRDKVTRVFSSQPVQLHLVPRLQINGAVPPLAVCTGESWIIAKDATQCGNTAVVWSTDTVYEGLNCRYQFLLCSVLLQ